MSSVRGRKVNVLVIKFLKVWLGCHEWIVLGMKLRLEELE